MAHVQVFLSDDNHVVHELTEERISIGRLPDNMLQIEDESVSSRHAELVLEGADYHLHDLGSTNGTFVNGEPIQSYILRHGDQIRFGQIETVFANHAEESEAQPLPEVSTAAPASIGQISARPVDFVSSSPISKQQKTKDPVATAAFAIAGLSLLVFAGAIASILTLAAPL